MEFIQVMAKDNQEKLKFYPLQAFSYDSLVPSILFHNTETAFRLNGSIHPEQSTMNAFQIIENFFVKSSQFFV